MIVITKVIHAVAGATHKTCKICTVAIMQKKMTLPFSQERCKDQIAYDLVLKKFIQYIESEQAEKIVNNFASLFTYY